MIGVAEHDTHFNTDLIININSVFMSLRQMGVGPPEGFTIKDEGDKWTDFLGDDKRLEAVKSYIFLKTKMLFDPPLNSFVVDAMERQAKEFEWRLNVQVEG